MCKIKIAVINNNIYSKKVMTNPHWHRWETSAYAGFEQVEGYKYYTKINFQNRLKSLYRKKLVFFNFAAFIKI